MKFTSKNYKLQKTKLCFQKTPIFFVFNTSNVNSKNWVKTEQVFFNLRLKYYRLYNNLASQFLEKSIYKNINVLISGFLCLIYFNTSKKIDLNLSKLTKLDSSISFLGLKLNNKFYSLTQLNKVSTLNYRQNIKSFNSTLKRTLEIPYKKLNNKNRNNVI